MKYYKKNHTSSILNSILTQISQLLLSLGYNDENLSESVKINCRHVPNVLKIFAKCAASTIYGLYLGVVM